MPGQAFQNGQTLGWFFEQLYLSYIGARGVIIRGIISWRCEMQDEQNVTEWSNGMELEVTEWKSSQIQMHIEIRNLTESTRSCSWCGATNI